MHLSFKNIFLGTFLVSILLFSSYFTYVHLYDFHFVDEDENILSGKLINQGLLPYQHFFVQHQPLAYYTSALLQRLHPQPDVLETIKTHRLFVLFWNSFLLILSLLLFPLPAVLIALIVESIKFELFGTLFLSDTLVMYALLFLFLTLFKKKQIMWSHPVAVASILLSTMIALTYQMGWLFVLIWYGYMSIKHLWYRVVGHYVVIIGCIAIISLILPVTTLSSWWEIVVKGNMTDCQYIYTQCSFVNNGIQALLIPFKFLIFGGTSGFSLFERIISLLFLHSIANLIFQRPKFGIFIYMLICTLALRPLTPQASLYTGFHKLPLFTLMIATVFMIPFVLKKRKMLALHFLAIAVFMILSHPSFFIIKDRAESFHIYFSDIQKNADILNQKKSVDSTLFVLPDAMLLYYLTDFKPASYYIFFYEWMLKNPDYKRRLQHEFAANEPDLVFVDISDRAVFQPEIMYLLDEYVYLGNSGDADGLYILKQ